MTTTEPLNGIECHDCGQLTDSRTCDVDGRCPACQQRNSARREERIPISYGAARTRQDLLRSMRDLRCSPDEGGAL